jgi:3-deoxy-manno-octulosonate cytidylyltransferase (CMP-KDO synthetase)
MAKTIAIIPARMKSGRFPGKPMKTLHGVPMIGHCWYRSNMCKKLDALYVATPDEEIYDYIKSIGGKPVMTSHKHRMCNDRVLEALLKVEQENNTKYDIVVCIQGDQPMVYPQQIEGVIQPLLEEEDLQCTTMMDEIKRVEDHDNPNKIKIVTDLQSNVLYMSREPIPSRKKPKDADKIPMYRHVALTAFKREFFLKMNSIEMSPLESVESIDDIRYLEHGYKVRSVFTDLVTDTVDTEEDRIQVEKLMDEYDELLPKYADEALAAL